MSKLIQPVSTQPSLSENECEEQPLCLVLGCDDGFARPLGVALFSALLHLDKKSNVTLFVIDGGITAKNKTRLEGIVRRMRPSISINWIVPSAESMLGLEGARHLSVAAYLRLFIPSLIPADVSRVLYLDCDVLVRGDLTKLWNFPLAGASLAACRDFAISHIGHPWSAVKDYQELGLNPNAAYFNSGVLLINIAQWRKEKTAAKVLAYAVKHGSALANCDQDALNATLSCEWITLDYRWNVQYALLYLHDLPASEFVEELLPIRSVLLKEARIVHFTGTPKPWNHWCGHPATGKWVKSLLLSGWFTPVEAVKWALIYGAKRAIFMLKVFLHLRTLRERTN